MNFLSHHYIARQLAPAASPTFFLGNALPDLLSLSGEGRLRSARLPENRTEPLVQGIALHLETDRLFHALDAFKTATVEAAVRLRSASFAEPPHRLFFVAHVLVEVGIDGSLLRRFPDLADDFYQQLAAVSGEKVSEELAQMVGRPVPHFEPFLRTFIAGGRMRYYATIEEQVEAIRRIQHRAGLAGFSDGDLSELARLLLDFTPTLEQAGDSVMRNLLAELHVG